jgi:hypothetical protein
MAAKTPGTFEALSNDRWRVLTTAVGTVNAEPDNSELIVEWLASTRQILGRMIHGCESNEEYDLLGDAEDAVRVALEDAATDLVEKVETRRQAAAA